MPREALLWEAYGFALVELEACGRRQGLRSTICITIRLGTVRKCRCHEEKPVASNMKSIAKEKPGAVLQLPNIVSFLKPPTPPTLAWTPEPHQACRHLFLTFCPTQPNVCSSLMPVKKALGELQVGCGRVIICVPWSRAIMALIRTTIGLS
eukprot:scaffold261956_cov22-Tisochrysis_lutea.AAC.2